MCRKTETTDAPAYIDELWFSHVLDADSDKMQTSTADMEVPSFERLDWQNTRWAVDDQHERMAEQWQALEEDVSFLNLDLCDLQQRVLDTECGVEFIRNVSLPGLERKVGITSDITDTNTQVKNLESKFSSLTEEVATLKRRCSSSASSHTKNNDKPDEQLEALLRAALLTFGTHIDERLTSMEERLPHTCSPRSSKSEEKNLVARSCSDSDTLPNMSEEFIPYWEHPDRDCEISRQQQLVREKIEADARHPPVPSGSSVMCVGRLKGLTFAQILRDHRHYVKWVLKQDNLSPAMDEFVRFARASTSCT